MRKYIFYFLCSIIITPYFLIAQQTDSLSAEQQLWLAKSFRTEKAGWIYLHLEGNAQERGFQHGYLLAKEINEAIQTRAKIWKYQTAMDWLCSFEKRVKCLHQKSIRN
jgi:hypothetical protein